jgi:HEAT repeat protein
MSRCLITSLAVSLCLLLLLYGLAQGQSGRITQLIEQLKSPDAKVRVDAASALGEIGAEAKEAAPVLIAALNDNNSSVRSNAATALGQMGAAAKEAMPALIAALQDKDFYVRGNAATALGQLGAEAKGAMPALIAALQDKDFYVCGNAATALGKMGAEAKDVVPVLIKDVVAALIAALKDEHPKDVDHYIRLSAASALGQLGAEAKGAMPALIVALQDKDFYVRGIAATALGQLGAEVKDAVLALLTALKDDYPSVRSSAATALGQIRAVAKEATLGLIAALKDNDSGVRSNSATALGEIGAEAKEAAPVLIAALTDNNPSVRSSAATALSQMGAAAKEALPALTLALKNKDHYFRSAAAEALALIGQGLCDAGNTEMLPQLRAAYESLKDHSDLDVKKRAFEVKRTIDYFESLWWVGLREKIWLSIVNHQYIIGIIVAYLFLLVCWSCIFWLQPLWLLSVSAFFSRYEPKIKTQNMEISLPLRHLLLISLFHYRKRVLERWVQEYLATVRENFASKQIVKERKTYVQTPAMMDEQTCDSISPAQVQPIFNKPKTTLLISGEGGAGKTSLACQMAAWAMADEPEKRLCNSHQMIPVLIESNLEPQAEGKDAFTETLRGHLSDLIGTPDAVPKELLLQLLRKRRVLVIVDSLSELDDATRHSVRPVQADFPVAALIITSRTDDNLRGATRTIIRPLRLQSNRLFSFMDRYLEQRGKRELFETDKELFESCDNLSQIIGSRDITALIAKMYAEQMIASKEQSSNNDAPRNLPDLMLDYASNINESVQADRKDTRAVLRVAKVVAWECLKKTFRPTAAKRDDGLKALKKEPDGDAMLEYLEKRLQLIQTAGAGKDVIWFSLDPLAEYLASLYVIEHYGNSLSRWQEILDQISTQPGAPETIQGFLLALLDCCTHHGTEYGVPASAIAAIHQILSLASELVVQQNTPTTEAGNLLHH